MSLTKFKKEDSLPGRSLLTNMLDLDRFFDSDFINKMRNIPSANVKEKDNKFEVELAVPGMEKQDFKIEIDDNVLTISAEKKEELTEEKENFTRREFSYNSFVRSFEIPATVNAEAIDAKYQNGLLILTLPKRDEAISKNKKSITIS